jgi:2-polyprenyl-6-methoxyphenol hydroxylase-like FAD-dependent oxidoreductase
MQYDIIIIGYGMVGNVAALLLHQQGLSVAVVERMDIRDTGVAKAGRVDSEVMRIFEQLNLRKEIERYCSPLEGSQIIARSGRVLVPINQAKQGDYAQMYGFYQPDVQRILQKAVANEKNIHVFDACEVNDISQNDEAVFVAALTNFKTKQLRLKGRYLLVCSGAQTPIAQLCELKFIDYRHSGHTLNVETRTAQPVATNRFAQTIYDLELPVTRISNSAHQQRWEFELQGRDINKENTPENVRRLIEQLLPQAFDIETVYLHQFDSKVLRQWHSNRIVFAGDAAHTMPPYLGMSLSAGIKDVYNLSWKLGLMCRGLSSDDILRTYKGERAPAAAHLISLNVWIQRLFGSSRLRFLRYCVPFIPKAFLRRQLDLSTKVDYGVVGTSSALRGRLLPAWNLSQSNNDTVAIDKLLGANFAVVGFDINPVDAIEVEFVALLATLRCTFLQICPKNKPLPEQNRYTKFVLDHNGEAQKYCTQHKAAFFIIRPDHLIFDAARDYIQLNDLLETMSEKLHLFTAQPQIKARPTDHDGDEDLFEEQSL